jgi:hypothetical protein
MPTLEKRRAHSTEIELCTEIMSGEVSEEGMGDDRHFCRSGSLLEGSYHILLRADV